MKKEIDILRIQDGDRSTFRDRIVIEFPLTIILNDEQLVTLLCSPTDLDSLALGFLSSEGFIKQKEDVKRLHLDETRGIIRIETKDGLDPAHKLFMKRVLTTGCGSGLAFYSFADTDLKKHRIPSGLTISAAEIMRLNLEFQGHSEVYRETHGVHSAALCDRKRILIFAEDIGRHNAVDKVFGRCLQEAVLSDDKMMIISGRISSEILFKVAKRNIPILVSKSVPTDMGVSLARDFHMTLVGFARGKRMHVYAGEERIINHESSQSK
jgi:FdhD protein